MEKHDLSNWLRAAIVAGDRAKRRKLEAVLEPLAIAASMKDVGGLLDACDGRCVDVVVLWSAQSSASWQRDLHRLARAMPTVKIVVTAADDHGRGVRRALRAGASGFVSTSAVEHCLLATIHAATVGQICVPLHARGHLARPALSHREKRVLQLLALGHTNNEIAGRLFLAESTVKRHVSACFRKLGVASRAEAAAVVLDPQSGIELGIAPTPIGASLEL